MDCQMAPFTAIAKTIKPAARHGLRYEVVLNMTILALFANLLSAMVMFKLLENHLVVQEVENAKLFVTGLKSQLQFLIARNELSPAPHPALRRWRLAVAALFASFAFWSLVPVTRTDWLLQEAQLTGDPSRQTALLRAAARAHAGTAVDVERLLAPGDRGR